MEKSNRFKIILGDMHSSCRAVRAPGMARVQLIVSLGYEYREFLDEKKNIAIVYAFT